MKLFPIPVQATGVATVPVLVVVVPELLLPVFVVLVMTTHTPLTTVFHDGQQPFAGVQEVAPVFVLVPVLVIWPVIVSSSSS